MKIEFEISENTIPTIIGQAAKHNGVEKSEVTEEMFEEELGKALKFNLFNQVSDEFRENMDKQKNKDEKRATEELIKRADVNPDAEDGIVLKIENEPEYMFVGDDMIKMRIGKNVSIERLLSEFNIERSEFDIIDWVDQGDGTTLFTFVKNN